MKFKNPLADLNRMELILWLSSIIMIVGSFIVMGGGDRLSMAASLIGVTALIFVAKGYVIGQVLTVVFAVFYGVISFFFRYYGEMITYLGMSAPMAVFTIISWLRHPFEGSCEVQVNRLSRVQRHWMFFLAAAITAAFFFVLKILGNANLAFSTLSVTTSFLAAYLTFFRSPFYALAYAANDIVLIILWVLAAMEDISYLSMVICFSMFFLNDLYGFYNWRRMQRRQALLGSFPKK